MADAWQPIGQIGMNEMADDIEGTEGIRSVIRMGPIVREINKERAKCAGSSMEWCKRKLEIEEHGSALGKKGTESGRKKTPAVVIQPGSIFEVVRYGIESESHVKLAIKKRLVKTSVISYFWIQILRKEVIQPQVPLRLPCYDLVPIKGFAFDAYAASGAPLFRGLTGGVYKAQEHIHRSVADLRLLAIPTSRRRVAAFDLNWAAFFGICSRLRVGIPLFAAL